MNEKTFSERDICSKFISPALQKAGWDLDLQVREEYPLTNGRIIVRGNLHKRMRHFIIAAPSGSIVMRKEIRHERWI